MRSKLKHWLGNTALAAGALTVVLAFLEFVVFGVFLKPDDVLANVTINGVVRYQPGSVAIFRHPDGRTSRVGINANGWNSTKPHYAKERVPGRLRVAVIGDSYVHASYVDTRDAFPDVIERRLKERGIDAEVLRFGMDGAPLSQYLNVLRREVVPYKPDIVLVQLIHNDFDESYRLLKTRYASSFMKLDVSESGEVREVPPADFEPTMADALRRSAMFRYLYYETNLYLTARTLVSRYFWGGEEEYDPAFIVSGVDVRNLDDVERMRRAAAYTIAQMKAVADAHDIKLVLAMDAVRETIYGRQDARTDAAQQLNELARAAAQGAGVPLLDLTATFRDDYDRHRMRFEYTYDWHWNRRANRLVGETLVDWMLELPHLITDETSPAARALQTGVRPGQRG